MVRALPCHGRGYGFEPRHSRQSSFAVKRQRRMKTAAPELKAKAGCMRQGSALRTTTRQATMEFPYAYIPHIALKPLASRSHQKTLHRPDNGAT